MSDHLSSIRIPLDVRLAISNTAMAMAEAAIEEYRLKAIYLKEPMSTTNYDTPASLAWEAAFNNTRRLFDDMTSLAEAAAHFLE